MSFIGYLGVAVGAIFALFLLILVAVTTDAEDVGFGGGGLAGLGVFLVYIEAAGWYPEAPAYALLALLPLAGGGAILGLIAADHLAGD